MDETYYQALAFCQKSTREDGIDAALIYNGTELSALLVPPEVGQTYQIAAQAGEFRQYFPPYSYGPEIYKSSKFAISQLSIWKKKKKVSFSLPKILLPLKGILRRN